MKGNCLSYYRDLITGHQVRITLLGESNEEYPFPVTLEVDGRSWTIFIQDEYGDLTLARPLISLYLVFRAFAAYRNTGDYLEWCNYLGLEVDDTDRLDYYRSMNKIIEEVKEALGSIDPCISDLDYDLRSGDFHALVEAEQG